MICVRTIVLLFFMVVLMVQAGKADAKVEMLYQLDFHEAGADGREWLSQNGFELAKEMKKGGEIEIAGRSVSGGLLLSSDRPVFGFAVKKDLHVKDVAFVELEWGVIRYPGERLWSQEVNREPLMVQLFFGEKAKADKFYLPDSPRMVGMFLCKGDPTGIPFTARSYRETARYVCLESPPEGKAVMSRFPVSEKYREWFGTSLVPPVTGIGIEMDTSGVSGSTAKAFMRKITLYGHSK